MTNEKPVKEPFIRIVKREGVSLQKSLLINAIAILAALIVTSIFCAILSPVSSASASKGAPQPVFSQKGMMSFMKSPVWNG